jgi:hypothetical protein
VEYIELGQAPAEEECAQVGEPNYSVNARRECRSYIQAIRNYLGIEPDGAALAIKSFGHEFGQYMEVIVKYDPENEAAAEYAFKCEGKAPATWAEGSVAPPPRYTSEIRR